MKIIPHHKPFAVAAAVLVLGGGALFTQFASPASAYPGSALSVQLTKFSVDLSSKSQSCRRTVLDNPMTVSMHRGEVRKLEKHFSCGNNSITLTYTITGSSNGEQNSAMPASIDIDVKADNFVNGDWCQQHMERFTRFASQAPRGLFQFVGRSPREGAYSTRSYCAGSRHDFSYSEGIQALA